MLTFIHLTKRFGKFTAVDDLSFEVRPQEAVALWGPNGAGKTTAIKCLLGLLAYEGRIEVNGLDAARAGKAVRRQLGYVPQELSFYDDMSTLDMAEFYARLKKVSVARAQEVIAQVGLAGHERKPVGALSGGMKQRLALGLALLADPPILVLDEPTSNLDAAAREQFLRLLGEVKAAGKTILFTSHRLEEIEHLGDRVLVLGDGRLQFICPAEELPARLGLRATVKVRLAAAAIPAALDVLHAGGYTATTKNGAGLRIDVPHGEKARPLHLLSQADILIDDFEIE